MPYFSNRPSAFVRALIASDAFLYASLNIVNILFAVFVTTKIPGGTVQTATRTIIAGLLARIVTELVVGKHISGLTEKTKVGFVVLGMALISINYAGFAISGSLNVLTMFWIIGGLGWGLALPTKLSLAAVHINPKQANQEWGLTDAINMSLIIFTMVMGSYIAATYSYKWLFVAAGALNTVGIVPYVMYLQTIRRKR
jgi:hypothetical protein